MLVLAITILILGLFPNVAVDVLITPAADALLNTPAYIGGII